MTEFEKTLLDQAADSEAIIIFNRDEEGKLFMTPIFSDADKITIPKMVSQCITYSDALKQFAEDVINRQMKADGRHN